MNSSFVHAVAASLPDSGHSHPNMGEFFPADIRCLSHGLSQLKPKIFLNPRQSQLRRRINSEALNTELRLFYPGPPPRIRRHFWLVEYPAQSTQVRTFPYHRDRSWSVMSFFLLDSPPISLATGDQLATPAVQYPPMPPDPVSNPRPMPAGFVAIPGTARARGDSVNNMSSENVSGVREAREHVQRMIDTWVGDAKTVLKFVSPAQLILCLLSY
jgi:hypothetical protein